MQEKGWNPDPAQYGGIRYFSHCMYPCFLLSLSLPAWMRDVSSGLHSFLGLFISSVSFPFYSPILCLPGLCGQTDFFQCRPHSDGQGARSGSKWSLSFCQTSGICGGNPHGDKYLFSSRISEGTDSSGNWWDSTDFTNLFGRPHLTKKLAGIYWLYEKNQTPARARNMVNSVFSISLSSKRKIPSIQLARKVFGSFYT